MARAIRFLKERLRWVVGSPAHWEEGQALVIVVFGIFGLLAMVGLAVDLGLYYIERVRITRAVDAATLAAAYELPMEDAAHLQAQDYLLQNGYDPNGANTQMVVDGQIGHAPGPDEDTETFIKLDTQIFSDQDQYGSPIPDTAYRIQVQVTQTVPVIFLQFVGFDNIYCYASATAENINNLDIAIVFDKSGSMEFDTLCYGCWESAAGVDYPDGIRHPLPWQGSADWDAGDASTPPEHCQPTQYYGSGGHDYYFIEAEEYSYASNTYDRALYTKGYTYWVLQRRPNSASARGRDADGRGAYIMHMPYPDMEHDVSGSGVTCRYEEIAADVDPADGMPDAKCWFGAPGGPYDAPRVDYNFAPVEDRPGGYYIWVRGQAAVSWPRGDGLDLRLFWGIDGVLGDGVHAGNCGGLVGCETSFTRGTGYDGATNNWQWRRLNDLPLYWGAGETHTLNFWAGGCEFALDRILITTNPGGSDGNPPDGPILWNSQRGAEEWANGRMGWVCDRCDARFAGYPSRVYELGDPSAVVYDYPICDRGANPDRRFDAIYDDEQPIRASVEAAKVFVSELLDPNYDQVGYVRYSSSSEIASELQCLRRLGRDNCNEQVIESTVIAALDATTAGGSTNIAGGMLDGLEVLSTQGGHYGRPGATHVMIVMTDGRANQVPNSTCYSDSSRQWPGGNNAQDCVIYYAHEARNNSVIVFTITLGGAADFELMQEVADLTGGVHRNADRPEKLPMIFDELYELMYLRLVE